MTDEQWRELERLLARLNDYTLKPDAQYMDGLRDMAAALRLVLPMLVEALPAIRAAVEAKRHD